MGNSLLWHQERIKHWTKPACLGYLPYPHQIFGDFRSEFRQTINYGFM